MKSTTIREWMTIHADEYSNGVELAKAVMDHFSIEEDWIWDTAQQIFDINKRQNTSKRYA